MRRRKVLIGASVATLLAGSGAAIALAAGPVSAATGIGIAPYVDLSANSADMLDTAIAQGGLRAYTAAFIIGSGCTPIWGDTLGIDNSTANARIARAQQAGATTIISFGGAGGAELGQSCGDVNALTAAYQSVINKYHVSRLDFDIEGAAIADQPSIDRRFTAIRNLENANGGLSVSLTIPVLESGPDGNGTNFLRSAKAHNVTVAIINAMTMDYGHAQPDMAGAAKSAAQGTLDAARSAGFNIGFGNIGVTPMIGNNDSANEVVDQNAARSIVSWANSNGVGRLAFWSVGRDQPCAGGGVSPNCSGLGGAKLDFTRIFTGSGGGGNPPPPPPPPPPPGNPPPPPPPGGGGSCGPAWNASTAYVGGSVVSFNGRRYTAKWWTMGEQPNLNLGDGKPWSDNGPCSGGGGNPPPAPPPPPGNPPPPPPPPPGGTTTWVTGHAYAAGNTVLFNGRNYKCLQPHTSQVGWEPPNVPALWQAL